MTQQDLTQISSEFSKCDTNKTNLTQISSDLRLLIYEIKSVNNKPIAMLNNNNTKMKESTLVKDKNNDLNEG